MAKTARCKGCSISPGLPYVGSGVIGSAVGMDKDMQKRLFLQAGLPVGDFAAILRSEWESGARARPATAVAKKFRFPLFVKPATLGSSVGMTKVHKRAELPAALDFAAEFAQKIVVERNIRGREIEVSVLGNDDPEASVPGEIIPHREFYDYTAKYLEEGTRAGNSGEAHAARRCASFRSTPCARFAAWNAAAWRASISFWKSPAGRIYLNEINTIPGFTSISMYPKLWEASRPSYRDLIDRLIDLALAEHREKQRTKYSIELPAGSGGALEA